MIARFLIVAFAWLLPALSAQAGEQLRVEQAWIRTAPPGAMAMAGYAVLRNTGDAPAVVKGASSDGFASVSLHETVESDGVARMRAVDALTIAPGGSVALAPGGKHLMLMHPTHQLAPGVKVTIEFELESGAALPVEFIVRDDAPDAR